LPVFRSTTGSIPRSPESGRDRHGASMRVGLWVDEVRDRRRAGFQTQEFVRQTGLGVRKASGWLIHFPHVSMLSRPVLAFFPSLLIVACRPASMRNAAAKSQPLALAANLLSGSILMLRSRVDLGIPRLRFPRKETCQSGRSRGCLEGGFK
jgi:hypothetical protein